MVEWGVFVKPVTCEGLISQTRVLYTAFSGKEVPGLMAMVDGGLFSNQTGHWARGADRTGHRALGTNGG